MFLELMLRILVWIAVIIGTSAVTIALFYMTRKSIYYWACQKQSNAKEMILYWGIVSIAVLLLKLGSHVGDFSQWIGGFDPLWELFDYAERMLILGISIKVFGWIGKKYSR